MSPAPAGTVTRAAGCELICALHDWRFAVDHAAEIEAHWQRRTADVPGFFDGRVHLLSSFGLSDGVFRGEFFETGFKRFLYWRDTGRRDTSVFDTFGSALLRSCEGHVILGRQRPGNLNAGLAYLPGGFIDPRDVTADGVISIEASIERELREETGLDSANLTRTPGYLVIRTGQQIALAVEYISPDPASAMVAAIRRHVAAEADPELEDAAVVRNLADLDAIATPDYARILLHHLFA